MKLFDGHCDTILGLLGNPKSGPLPPGSLYENGLQVDLKRGLEMEAYAQTFALFGFREMGFPDIFDTLYSRFTSLLPQPQGRPGCRKGREGSRFSQHRRGRGDRLQAGKAGGSR